MNAGRSGATRPPDAGPPGGDEASSPGNPARAVYGTVLAGSLIVSEGARDQVDIPRLLIVVLVTQVVFWLAHVYSELVGHRVEGGARPRGRDVVHLMREEGSLVVASLGPLVVVAAASLLGARDNTAVLAGLWAIVALLGLWALIAARRARMGTAELALYVTLGAALGVSLILLKVLVH